MSTTPEPQPRRRVRLLEPERSNLAAEMKVMYESDPRVTIHQVAAHFERSYGMTHQLLREAETEFRPQGGNRRAAG